MIDEKIFEPGKVKFNDFEISFEIPLEDQWNILSEDLVQVEYSGGFIIDMGWYPECDADGKLIIVLVRNYNWDQPIMKESAESMDDILSIVKKMKDYILLSNMD